MKRNESFVLVTAMTALMLAGCAAETSTNTTANSPKTPVESSSSSQQTQQASSTPILTVTSIPLDNEGEEIEVPEGTPLQTMQFTLDGNGKATPNK